ncbi:hypothetical protein LEMLEM_LOCUS21236 [Lemmus lemmus]
MCTWRRKWALGHPELLTPQPGGPELFGETISGVTAKRRLPDTGSTRAAGPTVREAKICQVSLGHALGLPGEKTLRPRMKGPVSKVYSQPQRKKGGFQGSGHRDATRTGRRHQLDVGTRGLLWRDVNEKHLCLACFSIPSRPHSQLLQSAPVPGSFSGADENCLGILPGNVAPATLQDVTVTLLFADSPLRNRVPASDSAKLSFFPGSPFSFSDVL